MSSQSWGEVDSVSKQELRSALLETACNLDIDNCTEQARALYQRYTESNGTYR